jgi:hypothetical protein
MPFLFAFTRLNALQAAVRQSLNEEAIQEMITASLNSTFENGYSLKLSTHLNQSMVNFDIICILKNEMGFNSLSAMDGRDHPLLN